MRIGVVENPRDALTPGAFDELIDVRSPSEFAKDHLPGAINLPVLDDDERAEVGTLYVQMSKFEARRRGAALISRNVARHLEQHLAGKPADYAPLIYCWRGGQRSGAMARILSEIGWRVSLLRGGYRTYRRAVVARLYGREGGRGEPVAAAGPNLALLDGLTGVGKTAVLNRLAMRGAPVLDLETLAAHRGAVFGQEPNRPQPSQKRFESALHAAVDALSADRPALAEAESNRIGELRLPPAIWAAMRAAPVIRLEASVADRAAYIERCYQDLAADAERIGDLLGVLERRHGTARISIWRNMARQGEIRALVADLLVRHYDPAYVHSQARREMRPTFVLKLSGLDEAELDRAAMEVERRMTALKPPEPRRQAPRQGADSPKDLE